MSLVKQYIIDDKRVLEIYQKLETNCRREDIIIRKMNRSRQYVV